MAYELEEGEEILWNGHQKSRVSSGREHKHHSCIAALRSRRCSKLNQVLNASRRSLVLPRSA